MNDAIRKGLSVALGVAVLGFLGFAFFAAVSITLASHFIIAFLALLAVLILAQWMRRVALRNPQPD
jgi:branched-subunit amino acid transport protein AzlD